MEKVIVTCVLKSGGEYLPRHVYNLRDMCADFLPPHEFVCLTDLPQMHCQTIPLFHNWPGWWSKIELFKLRGKHLYFDLDTVLVSDCSSIVSVAQGKTFIILRDIYRGLTDKFAMGSGMMYWEDDLSFVYDSFLESPNYCSGGDQAFLEEVFRDKLNCVTYWQDICEGIVSYKANVRVHGLKPSDKIIVFHGEPRPWQQKEVAYPI